MEVVVRSYKEMRRFYQFGGYDGDPVFDWMQRIKDCDLVYDVGSANGLEGFFIHHLHGSRIVFVEPFTPSVETILKTIARLDRGDGQNRSGGNYGNSASPFKSVGRSSISSGIYFDRMREKSPAKLFKNETISEGKMAVNFKELI